MFILAVHVMRAQSLGRFIDSDGRNVNENASLHVNPTCVDSVEVVPFVGGDVVWVDLEHVVLPFLEVWVFVVKDVQLVIIVQER